MTPEQEFKVAFLKVCASSGLTPGETHELVKKALMDKEAFISTEQAWDMAKTMASPAVTLGKEVLHHLGATGIGTAIAAPPVIGYVAGDALARMQDVDDVDVEEMRKDNLIAEYRRLARALKSRKREPIR